MTSEIKHPPGNIEIECPRKGCGAPVTVNKAGIILTHKLPDGWRTCAATGKTVEVAVTLPEPEAVRRD